MILTIWCNDKCIFYFNVIWFEVATKSDTYYDDVNLVLENMNAILNDAELFRLHNE